MTESPHLNRNSHELPYWIFLLCITGAKDMSNHGQSNNKLCVFMPPLMFLSVPNYVTYSSSLGSMSKSFSACIEVLGFGGHLYL